MGHSQSYDLRNPEFPDLPTDPVRGVRRISKEHETPATIYDQDNLHDYREDELREKIRKEQLLKKREEELETLRIKRSDQREPIIDAFRDTSSSPTQIEFRHYDSMKHHSPKNQDDEIPLFKLHRHRELNNGVIFEFVPIHDHSNEEIIEHRRSDYPERSELYTGTLESLNRHYEIEPIVFEQKNAHMYSEVPMEETTPTQQSYNINDYPKPYTYNGQVSPLPRHQEVAHNPIYKEIKETSTSSYPKPYTYHGDLSQLPRHPEVEHSQIPRLIPAMVEHNDDVDDRKEFNENQEFAMITEIRAEKRMIIGVTDIISTNEETEYEEELHRQMELIEINRSHGNAKPDFVRPMQTEYETKCDVKYCTHVQIPDENMMETHQKVVERTTILKENNRVEVNQENRLTIVVDEKDLDGVIHLARDGEIGAIETKTKVVLEDKLHYHPYLPTLSLERRPHMAFYDKLP